MSMGKGRLCVCMEEADKNIPFCKTQLISENKLCVVDTEKLNFQKCYIDFDLRKEWLMHFQK